MQTETIADLAPGFVPISDLLGRVSEECSELSLTADRLHSLASMVIAQSTSVEVITNLQAIDKLTQYLAAFAKLFANCAAVPNASSWTLELEPLVAELTLGELVDRLAGREREQEEDSGDLDMF
jgi:hypothetical protein